MQVNFKSAKQNNKLIGKWTMHEAYVKYHFFDVVITHRISFKKYNVRCYVPCMKKKVGGDLALLEHTPPFFHYLGN